MPKFYSFVNLIEVLIFKETPTVKIYDFNFHQFDISEEIGDTVC